MFISHKQNGRRFCAKRGTVVVAENWRFLSNEEKEIRRKALCARRDSSRINLSDSFERWRNLRENLGMSKDKDLAKFLIDMRN